jgi:acyl-CoA reductase-like NAD-dependent aldehyde dehydrogenase
LALLPQLFWRITIVTLNIANDSQYGHGASIWTEDLDKAEKFSRMIQSGKVSVNNVVASDPSSFWRG